MSQRLRSCWVGVAALAGQATVVLVSPPALAQQGAVDGAADRELTTAGFPLARAFLVDGAPEIDGDVLGEAIWDDIVPATGFLQNTPDEGQPASERTEVRIIYTEDTVYFGIVCYVSDPSTIIVSDSRRDSSLDDTDSFQIIIDTYQDQQNGCVFGTNPAGIEYDGQVTNEGQGSGRSGGFVRRSGSRQQRGSGGGSNVNWDGVWQVVADVTDIGWTVEMAIPFSTLRYPRGDVQTWGLNFQRNIRDRNEQVYWSPLPRQYNINRISLAGECRQSRCPDSAIFSSHRMCSGRRYEGRREATKQEIWGPILSTV